MMERPQEQRAIFQREDMAEMSIVGQIVLATSNLGAHASQIRETIDVESLYWHCQNAMEQLKRAEVFDPAGDQVNRKAAKYRATRGLQLATAALAFIKAYDDANKLEQP